MADLNALRKKFAVPGILFDTLNELAFVRIDMPEARATVFLQGAHLADWQPVNFGPAIMLSHESEFAPGKAIRGGVPVIFPWFAGDKKRDRINGHPGPSHGFAKTEEWTLDTVQREPTGMKLLFKLGPSEESRSMGYDHFQLSLEFTIGAELTIRYGVQNTGDAPLEFEQALHTFYEIADIHETTVSGLEQTSFIDKTDAMKVKPLAGEAIHFTGTVDRVYENTSATCVIHDVAGRRRITARKSGSNTTIVWNPGKALPDLGEWEWHSMVAVETANVGVNAMKLASGASSTMELHVALEHA
jgi:glucose-6-phosphate 1-epimerase